MTRQYLAALIVGVTGFSAASAFCQESGRPKSTLDSPGKAAGFADLPPPRPLQNDSGDGGAKQQNSDNLKSPLRLNRPLRLSTTPNDSNPSLPYSTKPAAVDSKVMPAFSEELRNKGKDFVPPPPLDAQNPKYKDNLIPIAPSSATSIPHANTSKGAPRILSIEPNSGSTVKRNDQSLSLEWLAPTQIKVGRPFSYELVVRNNGQQKVTNVTVQDKLPAGIKLKSSEPICSEADGAITWNLGELAPRQDRRIRVELVADKRGEVLCHATVTATTPAIAKLSVTEPKIVIKAACLQEVHVGEPVTISMAVYNPGDGQADNVVVNAKLPEGLVHERGNELFFEVGSIPAGETKNVNLTVNATKAGPQSISARASGEGGLVTVNECKTNVVEPMLVVNFSGPKLRYLERQANYTVSVNNPGTAPANNVKVQVLLPEGFRFTECGQSGQFDSATRAISWYLGALKPGQKAELVYRCLAEKAGDHRHSATAVAQRGIRVQNQWSTHVEGAPALSLEVSDVDDPVEAGAETVYEIRVTNQGTREAANIEIQGTAPKEMQIKSGQGPTEFKVDGQTIKFAPLVKLGPKADVVFRVNVKSVASGDLRFRVKMTSSSLSEPVLKEESTRVYDDRSSDK